ncbi:MAG: endonuclease/exonuclease/phosphatase family protein [Chromatiaceae bacterium]
MIGDLSEPSDPQIRAVAEIIQRVRPDVLLLNEFDYDPDDEALRPFQEMRMGPRRTPRSRGRRTRRTAPSRRWIRATSTRRGRET